MFFIFINDIIIMITDYRNRIPILESFYNISINESFMFRRGATCITLSITVKCITNLHKKIILY